MDPGAVLLVVVLALALALLVWWAGVYNGLTRRRALVQESWRQIDVELHRRHDLIPNLVETVTGHAVQERETLDAVVRARAVAARGETSPIVQAGQEKDLSRTLGRLFAVAEEYPLLRVDETFRSLQRELSDTEDRIAAGRRFYNANVRALNTSVQTFPVNVVARMIGVARAEYFGVDDTPARHSSWVRPPRGQAVAPLAGADPGGLPRARLLRRFRP